MAEAQPPEDGLLLQEYAIAHEELSRCSNIFWTQAEFFLTLSTAMLGFLGYMISVSQYWISALLSIFGLLVALLWLIHGNRIGIYVSSTEKQIRKIECSHKDQFVFHIKNTQWNDLMNKRNLRPLERFSSSRIVRTTLPFIVSGLWVLALAASSLLILGIITV